MKQKLIKLYKFYELKKDVKEKVLNSFREQNEYLFLEENLSELLKELLKKHKIKSTDFTTLDDFKVLYDLSYSKGSGVCFTGNFEWKNHNIGIPHNFGYYHKYSTDIEFYEEYDEDELTELVNEKIVETREKEFKEIYYKICDEIEKEGYKQIEYEESEENIKEIIKINGYTFRENGDIENL